MLNSTGFTDELINFSIDARFLEGEPEPKNEEEVDKEFLTNAQKVGDKPCSKGQNLEKENFDDFTIDAAFVINCNNSDTDNEKNGKTFQKHLHKITLKTTELFDVTPRNTDIVKYCKSLIDIKFTGQCTKRLKNMRLSCLLDDPNEFTLSMFLQSMDAFLRSFADQPIHGEEEELLYYLQGLKEKREITDDSSFFNDAKRFLIIYKKRGFISEELNHPDYWGTRQQLLAGKIIADYVDKVNGPLDPVFGVLLCPVAGRAGPGDSGLVHTILFDGDGPLAYHSAVHDAFGYLLTFHDVGPGYNYVGATAVLGPTKCMSGQASGLYFWRDILKHSK